MKTNLKNKFRLRLTNDPTYRHGVLCDLYERQTTDERDDKTTRWLNYVGFSTADAALLGSLAQKILSRQRLSVRDERLLIKKLPKYWEQFTTITLVDPPALRRKGSGQRARAMSVSFNSNRRIA